MPDPDKILSYTPISEGRSLPLQADEAADIPLPSLLHPVERVRQINAFVGEFATHGAMDSAPRTFTRARLVELAIINAFNTATHNFNYATAKFNEAAANLRGLAA